MTPLAALAVRPATVRDAAEFAAWFARIATQLLNSCTFLIAGQPHRFADLEAYYRSPDHPDPFPHAHALQRCAGRWYFHRTGTGYRGGTFKGLDLTLGNGVAYFGMLIRGIVRPDGPRIAGPSRTVDYLLALTGAASVAELDRRIGERPAWDESSPLAILESAALCTDAVETAVRIGLTLKSPHERELRQCYIGKPYRFFVRTPKPR